MRELSFKLSQTKSNKEFIETEEQYNQKIDDYKRLRKQVEQEEKEQGIPYAP